MLINHNNKDPDCLGRVRVYLPMVGMGSVSPWYAIAKTTNKNNSGIWALPDIGTQVIVCFPYGNYSQGMYPQIKFTFTFFLHSIGFLTKKSKSFIMVERTALDISLNDI